MMPRVRELIRSVMREAMEELLDWMITTRTRVEVQFSDSHGLDEVGAGA